MGFIVRIAFFLLLTGCFGATLHPANYYQYTHTSIDPRAVNVVYPVYIDRDFGQADLVILEDALRQWNHVMNGYARFEIVDSHFDMQTSVLLLQDAWLLLKIDSHNPQVTSHSFHTMAFVNFIGGHQVYFVRDRLLNEQMLSVTLHEVGHTLGAKHASEGLMTAWASPEDYQCVDRDTALQVAQVHGWDLSHMNYCLVGGEDPPGTN